MNTRTALAMVAHAITNRSGRSTFGDMGADIGTCPQGLSPERAKLGGQVYNSGVGILAIVLLVAAVLLVVGAEWPRLMSAVGADARQVRSRKRRKEKLTVVQGDGDEDFAASVQRDLESLPVIEKHDGHPRR